MNQILIDDNTIIISIDYNISYNKLYYDLFSFRNKNIILITKYNRRSMNKIIRIKKSFKQCHIVFTNNFEIINILKNELIETEVKFNMTHNNNNIIKQNYNSNIKLKIFPSQSNDIFDIEI